MPFTYPCVAIGLLKWKGLAVLFFTLPTLLRALKLHTQPAYYAEVTLEVIYG